VSIVETEAERASKPVKSSAWEKEGRRVETHYDDLNEPVSLASIPVDWRVEHGAPFDRNGSVQQGYLYRVQAEFAARLAERFPELRRHFAPAPPHPAPGAVTDVAKLHATFAAAVAETGLRFAEGSHLARSFFAATLAKPFVILTGLSGSGKTQLAMKLGEWFGTDEAGRPRHVVIPVRPDWTGPEALFGYLDVLRSSPEAGDVYYVPDVLDFLLRATKDPERPYLLVLDEMNLAHVERYFADFLSGMESRRGVLPDLVLGDGSAWTLRAGSEAKLPLPRNLFVVGTVNIDETTYLFSPKVLDRATTFEFRVEADELAALPRPASAEPADDAVLRGICELVESDDWHEHHEHPAADHLANDLRAIHRTLSLSSHEFGHRTYYEALRFAAFFAATGEPSGDIALDLVVMQKLLPRLSGSRRRMEPVLQELQAIAAGSTPDEPRLPITHAKVGRMLEAVRANQFVSFTE
jgi:5-methylcytosine-specific restriction enzyme B